MKNIVHQAEQFSIVFGYERVDVLVAVEEAGPGETGDFVGQSGGVFAAVEGVISIPQRYPFGEITLLDVSDENFAFGHGLARVRVATKLGSQVLPPSSEKDCSTWCESAAMSDQTKRTRMVLPL